MTTLESRAHHNDHLAFFLFIAFALHLMVILGVGFSAVMCAVLATISRLVGYLFGSQENQEYALDKLEIFSDQSTALEEARLEAERILEAERAESKSAT